MKKFEETYDKKYSKILKTIKNFNNYNEQEPQTSTSSNIKEEKTIII
ncbi:hypothetical protein [Spiroplasma sp. AdecLV25b]|nr:hypothetical protein [Spiroplasma sp. AdecLV25b]